MKFLAWVMFLTTTACFITAFCKQQWEAQITAEAATYGQPSPGWQAAIANCENDADSGFNDPDVATNAPTTRPALASAGKAAASPAPAAVAAGDLGDAVK